MLHLDCPVPHVARLALRTHDRLARLFCERLKHTPKGTEPTASRPVQVSPVDVTRTPTSSLNRDCRNSRSAGSVSGSRAIE